MAHIRVVLYIQRELWNAYEFEQNCNSAMRQRKLNQKTSFDVMLFSIWSTIWLFTLAILKVTIVSCFTLQENSALLCSVGTFLFQLAESHKTTQEFSNEIPTDFFLNGRDYGFRQIFLLYFFLLFVSYNSCGDNYYLNLILNVISRPAIIFLHRNILRYNLWNHMYLFFRKRVELFSVAYFRD